METLFNKLGCSVTSNRVFASDKKIEFLFIKNPDGSPRWLWNATNSTPLFLKFYNIGSKRAQLFASLINLVFFFRMQRLVFAKKVYYHSANDASLIDLDGSWALFTGTVGPNNKAILYANNSFYKIAMTENGKKLIAVEYDTIQKVSENPILFSTPIATKLAPHILQLSDVSSHGHRVHKINASHMDALLEMSQIEKKSISFKDWDYFHELHREFNLISDERIPKNMMRKINAIIEAIPTNEKIELSLSQGDFTQWNMYENDGKLAIYDWEMARFDRSKAFDYFHFVIQQGVLVDHKNWEQIYNDIVAVDIHTFQKEKDGSHDAELNFYLKLYLLTNCMHYLTIYAAQPEWHIQVNWLLQIWNQGLNLFLEKKHSQRELLLMDFFDFLQNKEYATLKFINGFPEGLSLYSDIDMIINPKSNSDIELFFANHSYVLKINSNIKTFMNTLQVITKDTSLLSVDLIWKVKVRNLEILDAKSILKEAFVNRYGVKFASNIDVSRYIVQFYILNNAIIPKKYLEYKQAILNSEEPLDVLLKDYFECKEKNKSSLYRFIKIQKRNQGIGFITNSLQYLKDTLKGLVSNRGFIVTFSGVDGAGKSTVIENISYRMDKQFRKPVVVLRHRPSIFPILSVWTKGKEKAHEDAVSNLPRTGTNKNSLSSLLRFGYYYMDYVFGQFYIYFKYILRGKIVIYDRYYFDFINDSKRSNIVLPKIISSLGYKLLLKPKFNFFLYADAATILSRKKELDAPTIEKLTGDYLSLFSKFNKNSKIANYVAIENHDLNVTLDTIVNTIAKN